MDYGFFMPLETGFTVYSKSGCSYCSKVKKLLMDNQIFFVEVECDEYLDEPNKKEAFLSFIKKRAHKEYRTFPMVFKDAKFIGGFTETQQQQQQQQQMDRTLCFDDSDF